MGDGAHSAGPPQRSLLSSSMIMASGTVVSRLTGFLRAALILAAIGKSLDADVFTLANTIPNALYILVAGGIFNVVLVPQLVRAMKFDADGGDAYANRVVTLGLLVLAGATVLLVVAAPLLVRLIFTPEIYDPANAGALDSAYALMRYCVPQVFFYGAFVLVGQILNARGLFGPMMWAPIANNIISCGVLVLYITLYGSTDGSDGFTNPQELLLGLGSTFGIMVQTAILIPFLARAGFHYRPRFDFRGVGLSHTLRLGMWTLFFIVVNQIAYIVVNRIGSSSATQARETGGEAAGATVYQLAFLIGQVPHGIVTVSVVTATMPLLSRLAADHLYPDVRAEIRSTMRLILSVIAPIAVATLCLGQPLATLMASYGALKGQTDLVGLTIMAFTPAMIFFSIHFLMLRGFYAMEDTRTPFLIQVVLSGTNITLAYALTASVASGYISTMLALAYGGAYLVGSALSLAILSHRIGAIVDQPTLAYFARLSLACLVAALVMLGTALAMRTAGLDISRLGGALATFLVGGALGAAAYLAAAWLLRLTEVRSIVRTVTRRGS